MRLDAFLARKAKSMSGTWLSITKPHALSVRNLKMSTSYSLEA